MKYRIITAAFTACLLCAFILLFLPNGGVEGENREKARFPEVSAASVKSGEFSEGFEAFISDNIGFRNSFIGLSKQISSYKGVKSPKGKVILADMDKGTGSKQASNLLVLNDAVMEMYAKNERAENTYAAAVNNVAQNIPDNIKLYYMLIPTRLEFAEPMYSNLQDSQRDAIDRISDEIGGGAERIDVYDTLKNHSDEYIYFRTDHHWTMLGSYYAYRKFCSQTGQKSVDINDYEKNEIEGFIGYLYAFADEPRLQKTPDTIEWYDVNTRGNIDWMMRAYNDDGTSYSYRSVLYNKGSNKYDFFLASDHAFADFTNSDLPDGKTIIIICDSYVNDFVPWMVNNYKNVIIIDPRSYKDSLKNTIEEFNPDEIMFLNYIFAASFEDYCNTLLGLY